MLTQPQDCNSDYIATNFAFENFHLDNMVSPGFRFSVGGFIAAIKIAIAVVNACKESGGAIAQYERTQVEFRAYQSLFYRLQDPDVFLSPDISSLIQICEGSARDFMAKSASYQSSLSRTPSTQHSGRHTLQLTRTFSKKVQWALRVEKDVEKLRLSIGPPLSATGVLMDLNLGSVASTLTQATVIDL